MGRAARINQDRKHFLAGLVDQRADAVGWRTFGGSFNDRIAPIQRRARAALEIDIGGAGNAEAASDDCGAVARDDGAPLIVDLGYRVHSLVRVDDDPPDASGMGTEDLDVRAA